jgi:protein phosphatase-4 regulatory subunit 3
LLAALTFSLPDDALSDDLDSYQSIVLPAPDLGHLTEIEQITRAASLTQAGRDALSKFIIRDEYISKLVPLVAVAEDLESLIDLHRLCNIMKSLILLNDNTIIETVVADHVILGVVGALECMFKWVHPLQSPALTPI